jgi:hypothetical protein
MKFALSDLVKLNGISMGNFQGTIGGAGIDNDHLIATVKLLAINTI